MPHAHAITTGTIDEESPPMADIAFVAIALAFFGLAYLYVLACDRIIGRDSPSGGAGADADRSQPAADRAEGVAS